MLNFLDSPVWRLDGIIEGDNVYFEKSVGWVDLGNPTTIRFCWVSLRSTWVERPKPNNNKALLGFTIVLQGPTFFRRVTPVVERHI